MDAEGSQLTLTAWIRADRFNHLPYEDARIISKADSQMESSHYWMLGTIRSNGATRLRFRLKTNGQTSTLIGSGGDLQTGMWMHVAAVYDGAWMKLYLNGQEVGRQAKSGNISTNPTIPVWIGSNPTVANSKPFDGVIDEMRVYRRALSPAEIEALAKDRCCSCRAEVT